MTKEDYVDGMLNQLLQGQTDINIASVGLDISNHLFDLKDV